MTYCSSPDSGYDMELSSCVKREQEVDTSFDFDDSELSEEVDYDLVKEDAGGEEQEVVVKRKGKVAGVKGEKGEKPKRKRYGKTRTPRTKSPTQVIVKNIFV